MHLRDQYGRPLRGEKAEELSFPQVPDREIIDGPSAWKETVEYLDQGLPFHMHEVCEQRWRCAPPEEVTIWQALAQWGAALTHEARGNYRGARVVALRAQENLMKAILIPDYIDQAAVKASLKRLLT
jgi:uncharacterized protein